MKLNVPEVEKVRKYWTRVDGIADTHYIALAGVITVTGKGGKKVPLEDYYWFFVNTETNQMAFKINKCYWAKGRKMYIDSKIPGFPSGQYLITFKAESNSYDHLDFVIVDYIPVELDTPRKALNWLEKRVAEMEALDGVTTEELVQQMGVR